jgi:LEA14-like dessication related protein
MIRSCLLFLLPVALVLGTLLSGCAALNSRLSQPTVHMADIRIEEVRSMEATFLVQLRVINPNDTLLEVQGLECQLSLDGHRFATGINGEQRQVPAYGSTLIPVEVYASVFDMVGSALTLLQDSGTTRDPISYAIDGSIRLGNRGLPARIPFTTTGQLNLDHLHRPAD